MRDGIQPADPAIEREDVISDEHTNLIVTEARENRTAAPKTEEAGIGIQRRSKEDIDCLRERSIVNRRARCHHILSFHIDYGSIANSDIKKVRIVDRGPRKKNQVDTGLRPNLVAFGFKQPLCGVAAVGSRIVAYVD